MQVVDGRRWCKPRIERTPREGSPSIRQEELVLDQRRERERDNLKWGSLIGGENGGNVGGGGANSGLRERREEVRSLIRRGRIKRKEFENLKWE